MSDSHAGMNRKQDRRTWLNWGIQGLASTALLSLMGREARASKGKPTRASEGTGNQGPLPKAKRAIQISLVGGLSHLDSFDYKPALVDHHGKSLNATEQPDVFFGQVGLLRQHDWAFQQRGESGLWVSELFPHLAQRADDLTIIKSMVSDSANHTPALFMANSGFQFNGYPSTGSWLSYGLGTLNETLPDFVVLADGRGQPNGGSSNWSSGFLPARHQGVELKSGRTPARDLFPPSSIGRGEDAATVELVDFLNQQHLAAVGEDAMLIDRIRSYELAARMQLSLPDACDLTGETATTLRNYGIEDPDTHDMGTRCLLGRRLLEQGVRFVQVYSGGPIAGSPRSSWDAHENVRENHSVEARKIDLPVAALLDDLKTRGMLEDTLVLFTTEFGRTPFTQSSADTVGPGRDHNRYGFSVWMAGAGLKPGFAYGETDELGWKATSDPVTWHDFHATVLHLFGIDHEALTYYHNGIQRRLTNVHGEVVRDLLS